ncbi:S8 family serine peptidase [Muricauda sp. CAU 1633]|uniref:S8 family serine peptidase n=1 Tax=Allomuricauda sp. CAU 1633 TaxID=2816036 RepID=UPI001A8E5253|nr:S8 family serine peptidase [Muricauda sp. CAU 1633]MBO0321831.1 S8 family serine peptidase [Muricauda sp. CAU 1633]
MKVTVSKFLNVRVGQPNVNAPNYQYLAPGSIIEVEDEIYKGQKHDGNAFWFKDAANNYYWSGGVQDKNSLIDVFRTDWNVADLALALTQFRIHELWKDTKGGGVDIAVLDTGYSDHPNLKKVIASRRNFLNHSNDVTDFAGHGTHVAGIIAANGMAKVAGIAPEVRLHIGKVANGEFDGLDPAVIASAIDWYSKKVDIISMSLGFPVDIPILKQAVNNCDALIVAAYGNDKGQQRTTGDYPASYPSCLSVGSLGFKNGKTALAKDTIRGPKLDIAAPGERIKSTYLSGRFEILSGSSMATPYVSGVLALLKNQFPNKHLSQIKNDLLGASSKRKDSNFNFNQLNISNFIKS